MSSLPALRSRTMWTLGFMYAGFITVDMITANLLPLTARHFTDNLGLIGLMVALNRVFGFLVQPYVAWRSDRTRSRHGRRRPYLLFGLATTFVAVGALGALPILVPGPLRSTIGAVALLFTINLLMQACLDVNFGAADPLYGDTFARDELGRAAAIRNYANLTVGTLMGYLAIPLADQNEFIPYLACMGFLAVSLLIAWRGLRETPSDHPPPPERYNPLRPLRELRDARIRRVAIAAACTLASGAVLTMLHALFVTETLGLTKTDLGRSGVVGTLVGAACTWPIGRGVDLFGPRRVLAFGFATTFAVGLLLALAVESRTSLYFVAALSGAAFAMVNVPVTPLIFRTAPAATRGSVFAAVQTVRAASAAAFTILAGQLADTFDSYRACYLAAATLAVVGLLAVLPGRGKAHSPGD